MIPHPLSGIMTVVDTLEIFHLRLDGQHDIKDGGEVKCYLIQFIGQVSERAQIAGGMPAPGSDQRFADTLGIARR
jgi:hypothetical protein